MIKLPQLSSIPQTHINPEQSAIPAEYNQPVINETQDAIWEARKDFFIDNLENG